MNDISVKSTAFLIDELLTNLIRCWWSQEIVMNSADTEEVAKYAKIAQETNARRSALIRAIDQRLGEGEITALIKTYDDEYFRGKFNQLKNEPSYSVGGDMIIGADQIQMMTNAGYKVCEFNSLFGSFAAQNPIGVKHPVNSKMEGWRWIWDNWYTKEQK